MRALRSGRVGAGGIGPGEVGAGEDFGDGGRGRSGNVDNGGFLSLLGGGLLGRGGLRLCARVSAFRGITRDDDRTTLTLLLFELLLLSRPLGSDLVLFDFGDWLSRADAHVGLSVRVGDDAIKIALHLLVSERAVRVGGQETFGEIGL